MVDMTDSDTFDTDETNFEYPPPSPLPPSPLTPSTLTQNETNS